MFVYGLHQEKKRIWYYVNIEEFLELKIPLNPSNPTQIKETKNRRRWDALYFHYKRLDLELRFIYTGNIFHTKLYTLPFLLILHQ